MYEEGCVCTLERKKWISTALCANNSCSVRPVSHSSSHCMRVGADNHNIPPLSDTSQNPVLDQTTLEVREEEESSLVSKLNTRSIALLITMYKGPHSKE